MAAYSDILHIPPTDLTSKHGLGMQKKKKKKKKKGTGYLKMCLVQWVQQEININTSNEGFCFKMPQLICEWILLESTIAPMYRTPVSVTAGQRPLCGLASGGVCTHQVCWVIQCTERKKLVFWTQCQINKGLSKTKSFIWSFYFDLFSLLDRTCFEKASSHNKTGH